MSTERGVTKRRLSRSEGTSIESDTANLREQQEQQQQQNQQYKEPPSTKNRDTSLSSSSLSLSQPNWGVKTAQDDENEDDINLQAEASGAVITTEEVAATVTATAESSVISGDGGPRQVIAVSANKNPTAFFQLARKFLMTNDMCDLSALEGAIVSAVDAAHLLERSQLASIVRIHTSYVNVEPKRRRQVSQKRQQQQQCEVSTVTTSVSATEEHVSPVGGVTSSSNHQELISHNIGHATSLSTAVVDPNTSSVSVSSTSGGRASIQNARQERPSRGSSGGRELRRARILVTVKRTESYKRWLDENPLHRQAIIAGEDIGDSNVTNVTGPPQPYHPQEESQK